MNIAAPTAPTDFTPADRVTSNKRQQAKLSWKRRQMQELAENIRVEVLKAGVKLPPNRGDYEKSVWQQLEIAGYDISDGLKHAWNEQHDELIRLYYSVKRTNKAVYAVFNNGEVNRTMLLSAWYNKHRFDMVWLWRKSQLIRAIYKEYLVNNPELRQNCHPIHMVLTVPHPDGLFKGKKFYARAILELFKEMRRCPFWKDHVHGGEYGLEIKKSKTNGLHIHVHSLVFLNKSCSVNEFRAWLKEKWSSISGGSMIHAETLYYYARKDNGQYVMEPVKERNNAGQWEKVSKKQIVPGAEVYNQETGEWEAGNETYVLEPVQRRKKHYIDENSTVDEYLQGVLECIKYHFKHDAAEDENGNWDLSLMADILNNSQRLRFYSRFGKFYKEKALCFDRLDKDEEPEAVEGEEIELNGDVSNAERNLINPFTYEPADPEYYGLFISSPEWLKYSGKKDLQPYSLITYGDDNFIPIQEGFTLKEIIGSMCRGEIWRVLKHGWRSKAAA